MLLGEDGQQKYIAKVPQTPHIPEAARKLLESYLRLADWNQLTRMEEGSAKSFNWAASPEMVEWRAKQSTRTIPPEQTRQLLIDLLHEQRAEKMVAS